MNLLVIGGGGHAKSVLDTIQSLKEVEVFGIIDIREKIGNKVLDVPVIGTEEDLLRYFQIGVTNVSLALGGQEYRYHQKELYKKCKKIGYHFPNIIDPSANVSKSVRLGEGNFIGKRAIINAETTIGNICIINTGAIVEHECIVEDFVHVAPGSTLCGRVHLKERSFVGARSVVIPNRQIGEGAFLGAGSVVCMDIGPYVTAVGCPAKERKKWKK